MNYSPALTAQLCALSSTLDDPGTDLQAILEVLADELTLAIPSFLGLTMTQQFDGFDVTMTAIDAGVGSHSCSSLQVPLDPPAAAGSSCTVVFYATEPGAFLQLAADIRGANGPDPRVVLDGPLPRVLPRSGVTGLAELSAVNRAIGVLITRGYFPDEARAELRRRIGDDLDSVPDAARRVLLSTNAPRPCGTIVPLSVALGNGRRARRPVGR